MSRMKASAVGVRSSAVRGGAGRGASARVVAVRSLAQTDGLPVKPSIGKGVVPGGKGGGGSNNGKPPMKGGTRKRLTAANACSKVEFDQLPVNEIWAEYAKTQRPDIRNYFWERYLPLVRYIAEKTYTRLPDEVDVGDLMSAGQFGLMDAIDAFDLAKGVKFETYSATRIKGAIIDELRAMDWVPRLVRHRTAKVSVIRDKFEMRNGRSPTDDEVSQALGATGEDLEKILKDSGAVMTVSLNRKAFNSDGNKEVTEIDVLKDHSQQNPLLETQRRDIKDMLTRGLSRAERLIVILYYYEEMTMKEIGSTLDLSESRVSQMHSLILARLKSQLQNRTDELEPDDRED